MALATWDDNLSVNVAELDLQHKQLIRMINDLHEAMRNKKGKAALDKIINTMIDYAARHFSLEEKYFRQFGYPEAAAHKTEHDQFIERVGQFKSDFEAGKLTLTIEVMNFLRDWLLHHIKCTDGQYGTFLNEQGLV